jgi:hypothetical protein
MMISVEVLEELIFDRIYAGGITWVDLDENEDYVACLIAAGWIDAA